MNNSISVSDAAREAGVMPAYLYQLLTAGRLAGTKVDGRWFLDRHSFNEWREGHKVNRRTAEPATA